MRPQPLVSPGTGTLRRLSGRQTDTLPAVLGRSFFQKTRPMLRQSKFAFFALMSVVAGVALMHPSASAQERGKGQHTRVVVVQEIDENKRVVLHGNTRPEANRGNDRGRVQDDYPMEHMLLQLKRP